MTPKQKVINDVAITLRRLKLIRISIAVNFIIIIFDTIVSSIRTTRQPDIYMETNFG